MKLKEEVDEIYREGRFYKATLRDITNTLSILNNDSSLKDQRKESFNKS